MKKKRERRQKKERRKRGEVEGRMERGGAYERKNERTGGKGIIGGGECEEKREKGEGERQER